MRNINIEYRVPSFLFVIAFIYYALLSAKSYTWLYASQDSGDWLMASSIWVVPQPVGSPLYILLGHFLNLFPGSLEVKMTVLLSVLPSAITVTLVYLVAKHLLGSAGTLRHLVPSTVLLGASIFLSQSTILEEYALTAMFLVLAYYCYIINHKRLTLLALGCATAVHIMGLLFFIMFAYVEWVNKKRWLKHSWVYLLTGILPYAYVPILMALKTPPFMAGYWSFDALQQYLFGAGNAIVFRISVFDFPERLILGIGLLIACIGLAVIPVVLAFNKPFNNTKKLLVLFVLFPVIYYLLCLDPSTWTFLTFSLPFLAILAGLGLQHLKPRQITAVAVIAMLFVLVNPFFFNPAIIEANDSPARDTRTLLESLPQNAVVLSYPGTYSMATYYINSTTRSDIIPIVWQETGMGDMIWEFNSLKIQYKDYCEWLSDRYGIVKDIPLEQIHWCLNNGFLVYVGAPEWAFEQGMDEVSWTYALKNWLTIKGNGRIRQITGAISVKHGNSEYLY